MNPFGPNAAWFGFKRQRTAPVPYFASRRLPSASMKGSAPEHLPPSAGLKWCRIATVFPVRPLLRRQWPGLDGNVAREFGARVQDA